jgi:hypothetical protein
VAKERKSKYENRNSPRKDLTQRAQGSEHPDRVGAGAGHREEAKKDSSSNNRSMAAGWRTLWHLVLQSARSLTSGPPRRAGE